MFMSMVNIMACSADSNEPLAEAPSSSGGAYFGGKKVLVAYFSWGGTTRRMAQEIQRVTGGDIFEIEPATPYPTNYTECTQVALRERDNDERPAIENRVENFDDYDVVFVGCPVWWHTAPMIISTFAESYDFKGKTVVPFCTYASTYRDETLQKIADLTPDADHLQGLGTTGSTSGVQTWIDLINEQWNENHSGGSGSEGGVVNPTVDGVAPMSGMVNLWYSGRIPARTKNVNNSDGPDFIPNMEVFTVAQDVTPKGAVVICPGGAFAFRSVQNEGMIYSFYGRLSVSMNNVATLRAANLPPAFYCWGTRDGFASQFTQNSNAVREAGCTVETHILQNYPHGYGTGGNASVWGNVFDAFLTPIMQRNTTAVNAVKATTANGKTEYYTLDGKPISSPDSVRGVYIQKTNEGSKKIVRR